MVEDSRIYTWEEVEQRVKSGEKWIVIENKIYNVKNWQGKHPGGAKILAHFLGQDATEAWRSMHNDLKLVQKYMNPLLVGQIKNVQTNQLTEDFGQLREKFKKMGLFKVKPIFYILHFLHIIGIECVAWYLLWQFGDSWPVWLVSACLLATAQAQAGWTQHDYGHLSVFDNFKLNHLFHQITIGHLKGASSHWWNFRHFQHHAKPNIHKKDPDITLPQVFLLGDHLPKEWGSQKRGVAPYNHQHNYFWILGPWFLLPGYFHLENIYFVLRRRDWYDVLWMSTFFMKFFFLGNSVLTGGWATFKFYMFVRWLESHWFVFVTQMNHLPMEIGKDHNNDWVTSQTISTCNVEPGLFNNWFSGHLNFQIEHHLFPTMPRHNYPKVAPYVRDLCKKHKLTYVEKALGTAFADIIRSLRKSGQLWFNAYYHTD